MLSVQKYLNRFNNTKNLLKCQEKNFASLYYLIDIRVSQNKFYIVGDLMKLKRGMLLEHPLDKIKKQQVTSD